MMTIINKNCLWIVLFNLLFFALPAQADLSTILKQIEQLSPEIKAAKARVQAASAAIQITHSAYWGKITAFAQDAHFNELHPINASFPVTLDDNQFSYGLNLTLPLDFNQQISHQIQAQTFIRDAARFQVDGVRLALFKQAVTLYRGLQRLTGVKRALSKQLVALQKHHKITQAAIRLGRMAKVKQLQIEAEIQNIKGKIAGVVGDDARLRAGLAALLDQAVFNEAISALNHMPTLDATPRQDFTQRPDILATIEIKKAKKAFIKQAESRYLPSVNLQANAQQDKGYDTQNKTNLSLMAVLRWDLWDGGNRSATVDKARADLLEASHQEHKAINQARAELTAAKAAWQTTRQQYKAAKTGLVAAKETEQIQSDLYQNGRVSAVDLIDTESALAQARANLATALANWWLADDQLYLVRGLAPSAYSKPLVD